MSKICFLQADLMLDSPLKLGNGDNENTDNDVLLLSDGTPYIPGTSLAGVCRHHYKKCFPDDVGIVFGSSQDSGENDQGKISFYDAYLPENSTESVISIRNGVHLENRVALDGALYDYEVVEAGPILQFRLELKMDDINSDEVLNCIINGFNNEDIKIGGKTSRGFGKVKVDNLRYLELDLEKTSHMEKFINFSWDYVDGSFTGYKADSKKRYPATCVEFEVESFILIRNYITTAIDSNNQYKEVDAEHLNNADSMPIIPGTSWAGAFRHHCLRILKKCNYLDSDNVINNMFGFVDHEEKQAVASKVEFSESIILEALSLNQTRTAIDRFTGSGADGALFTTRPSYLGKGELEIKFCYDDLKSDQYILAKQLINVCIEDLDYGLFSIGGETAIGGGILKVVSDFEGGIDE